jgi:phosphohistidine swiveling domain-containing protein
MEARLVYDLEAGRLPDSIGKKAAGLAHLHRLRVRLPKTWIVSYDGYRRYRNNDETVLAQLTQELEPLLDPLRTYAVRSSASIEDATDHTFAGQFKTSLNASSVSDVIQAIWSVWASAESAAVKAYAQRTEHGYEGLDMAVIVQEMVDARIAGVAFSRNPVTCREEIVIECVHGSGVALVQEGVKPLYFVNRWGRWTERPVTDQSTFEVVTAVAEQTRKIANRVGYDVDVEWAWDGNALHWLQMRAITSVRGTRIYSNAIAKEVLPGIIKPLVWSVNVPRTNGVWLDVISEVIGETGIDPSSLAKQFHYRAYFDAGTFGQIFESLGMPRDSLERMAGVRSGAGSKQSFRPGLKMMRHLPRMVRFVLRLWSIQGRAQRDLARGQQALSAFAPEPEPDLEGGALLTRLDAIFEAHRPITYYNVIVPFLLRLYEALLRRGMERAGLDYAALDLVTGLVDLEPYDLPAKLTHLKDRFCQLDERAQQEIRQCTYAEFGELEGVDEFRADVAALLLQFGYLSDSFTNFSNVTWREQPELILRLIADYPAPPTTVMPRVQFDQLPIGWLKRQQLRLFYRRARQFRIFREAFSAVYGHGLGLIRSTSLALGAHFVRQGWIDERDDVFYLYEDEIRQAVEDAMNGGALSSLVARRKAEIALSMDAELPEVIYGDQDPPLLPRSKHLLQGMATSPGYYTGTVKVITGIIDFGKLAAGDILVVPYSDVAWTPLFARAGAVVAESGGMLSHSSIIAREYGIPAVVSVEGALSLVDSATVTVNGYTGEVVLHAEEA